MTKRIIPLIMCGGAGTRLWPASREVRPKQFLPLFGTHSTFQETLLRVSDAALFERPIIITNAAYRFMVMEQLAEIGIEADVLLEPMRRDSGPAIVAGAAFAQARDGEAVVLALAADHIVRDTAAFLTACREGLAAAESGRIVTFGVTPERAATEYGYINPGEAASDPVRGVAKFVETPDQPTKPDSVSNGSAWPSSEHTPRWEPSTKTATITCFSPQLQQGTCCLPSPLTSLRPLSGDRVTRSREHPTVLPCCERFTSQKP